MAIYRQGKIRVSVTYIEKEVITHELCPKPKYVCYDITNNYISFPKMLFKKNFCPF
jgi:hypothetical protein